MPVEQDDGRKRGFKKQNSKTEKGLEKNEHACSKEGVFEVLN